MFGNSAYYHALVQDYKILVIEQKKKQNLTVWAWGRQLDMLAAWVGPELMASPLMISVFYLTVANFVGALFTLNFIPRLNNMSENFSLNFNPI